MYWNLGHAEVSFQTKVRLKKADCGGKCTGTTQSFSPKKQRSCNKKCSRYNLLFEHDYNGSDSHDMNHNSTNEKQKCTQRKSSANFVDAVRIRNSVCNSCENI